ncbi:MAG: 1,4-dihydroxy-2-naphthoate octaprenyltransferase [Neisseria sp.]|nr:1,4-dihydroxy-2-naphthoate octaprenyltransferase [Neisseria sp.]
MTAKNYPVFPIATEKTVAPPSRLDAWLSALRLRTLPLSIAGVGLGNILAWQYGVFSATLAIWGVLTALLLQTLANLANDYGDAAHHADGAMRQGPLRMSANGIITPQQMRRAIALNIALCIISGLVLLFIALPSHAAAPSWLAWLSMGALCIVAALAYTIGKKPYGYVGLGDLAVLIFFGVVAVGGMFLLQTGSLPLIIILPALSIGLWCAAVLNINNIRDVAGDALCGKITLAVRLGVYKARYYHLALLALALFCHVLFVWQRYTFAAAVLLTLFAAWFTFSHYSRMNHYYDAAFLNHELKSFSGGILFQAALIGIVPWFLGG